MFGLLTTSEVRLVAKLMRTPRDIALATAAEFAHAQVWKMPPHHESLQAGRSRLWVFRDALLTSGRRHRQSKRGWISSTSPPHR